MRSGPASILLLAAGLGACGAEPPSAALPVREALAAESAAALQAEFSAIADALLEGSNPILGRGMLPALRAAAVREDLPVAARVDAFSALAMRELELGEIDTAIALLEQALPHAAPGHPAAFVHYRLALCWLRRAEFDNCIARNNAECCLFPLQGGGLHAQRQGATRARGHLLEFLAAVPPGHVDALRASWLLNIAAMALGEWPGGVPAAWRLPESAFASQAPAARFTNVAAERGLDTLSLSGGVVIDDLDGDGLLDIVTSSYDPRALLRLHRGLGGGRFADVTAGSGLDLQRGGLNLIAGDPDGDGDVDLFVLRGAWLYDDGRIRNSLLRNDGGLRFSDVTRAAGLAEPACPTQTAAFGDFDGDGDLDLYVGNESRAEWGADGHYPNQLFRNDGGLRFTDVAAPSGVTNDRYTKGVAAGDYDDDGDLDLYVSNEGANRLYRNRGDGRFDDVAEAAGVAEPRGRSFACWFFDVDNDGDLDLFVAGFDAQIADLAAAAAGRPERASRPRLYRNRGDGTFADDTRAAGLDRPWSPMGAGIGDIDGDGLLDIYLATGAPPFEALMPNVMLRNEDGRRLLDVSAAAGLGHLQKGHGVGMADVDDDGDIDILEQLGGFYPDDRFHDALFENPGPARRFLVLDLVGTTANRAAVGARVEVVLRAADGAPRSIHRAAGCLSSFGSLPSRLEIGLGDAQAVERLVVRWPAPSRAVDVHLDVPLDARLRVVEGRAELERRPFPADASARPGPR